MSPAAQMGKKRVGKWSGLWKDYFWANLARMALEETIIKEAVLVSGVALVSLVVSIFVIRLIANAFIIAAFLLAIIVPPAWLYVQRSQGLDVDQGLLFIGSALFAFFVALCTVPLWPVSKIMQWTGKKEGKKIKKLEEKLDKSPSGRQRIPPRFDED